MQPSPSPKENSELPSEYWLMKKGEFYILREEILGLLEVLYGEEGLEQWLNFQHALKTELTEKVGLIELRKYMCWHIIIGSTPDFNVSPFTDLEGQFSMEFRLRTEIGSLKKNMK